MARLGAASMCVEFTAAMVETVFKYHTCITCQIAKWNHPAVGVGSGVDVNQPGHTVYLEVVTGVQPPSNYIRGRYRPIGVNR